MGLEVVGKGDTKEMKKEEEKIPHMYESIGHQPLCRVVFVLTHVC